VNLVFAFVLALQAPERLDSGRFTFVFYPQDRTLARSLAAQATAADTFPGLPRPTRRVITAIAPDRATFRQWIGATAPEWGAAVAFPESHRIVLQGRNAGTDAGDPTEVFRHEVAHLALHEFLGGLAPRWFDEGYASFAAREWKREDALSTNLSIVVRGIPTLDELEEMFYAGSQQADAAYAYAHRAVAELDGLGGSAAFGNFFVNWRRSGSLERAMRATYGMPVAGFERLWRQRTRRRYGMLSLVANFAVFGAVVSFVVVPLYLARRRRDRKKLAAMIAADVAAEKVARDSILESMLNPSEESGPSPDEDSASGDVMRP
jgi:hypothetical protein